MKITFGCIVFNILDTLPENMFEYCIQTIYEFAHEIIVVEGATKAITHYFDGDTSNFTKDGRSTDNTINYLYELQKKYPKIKIIIGDGFWNGKTEMCNAYAKIATGDYIWQLDSDEFYHEKDIPKIIELLEKDKPDAIHFYANHFFGGFNWCIDERCKGWGNDIPWMRIFKNIPGNSKWLSHEPPQYQYNNTICNNGKVLNRDYMLNKGIKMFHYGYVQRSQVEFKSKFFKNDKYVPYWESFKHDKNTLIFGSKVFDFIGEHPKIILENF